jgi:hypothetical protein
MEEPLSFFPIEFSETRLDLTSVTDMNENGINEKRPTTMCYMNKYFKKYGRKPKPAELEQFIKKEQWISQTYKPPLGT